MLGELEAKSRTVICDLEAGVGTLLRMQPGQVDVVLVVVEPSAKAIEVGRRASEIASERAEVLVVANRIRREEDLEAIEAGLRRPDLVVIADDASIHRADREGRAPFDVDPRAPGVRALLALAERLSRFPVAL